MGRELKRVPLDFNWPLNKPWKGFLNPHYKKAHKCEACDGSGSSPEARWLKALWYGYTSFRPEDRGSVPFTENHPVVRELAERNVNRSPEFYGTDADAVNREARRLCRHFNSHWLHHLNADDVAALVAAGRLRDFTHTWAKESGWQLKDPPYVPTPEEVNVWSIVGLGHDSINSWVVIRAECERLSVVSECPFCQGDGKIWGAEADKQAAEDWQREEPPAGPGYQIWETVSGGSPISPVFSTPEGLARHMAGTRWGADRGSSFETWLAFIKGPGWAPSMLMDSEGTKTGPEAAFGAAREA